MFKNILKNAELLQEFNDDVKPGITYRNANQIRKILQALKVEAQQLRVKVNEFRKQK